MCIPVQGDGPIGVAHAVLDRLQAGAVCQQQRGLAVAKLVEAELREAGSRAETAPPTLEVREVDPFAALVAADGCRAVRLHAELGEFLALALSPSFEVLDGLRVDGDRAFARVRLGVFDFALLGERLGDRYGSLVQVQVLPREPKALAAAHARGQSDAGADSEAEIGQTADGAAAELGIDCARFKKI